MKINKIEVVFGDLFLTHISCNGQYAIDSNADTVRQMCMTSDNIEKQSRQRSKNSRQAGNTHRVHLIFLISSLDYFILLFATPTRIRSIGTS